MDFKEIDFPDYQKLLSFSLVDETQMNVENVMRENQTQSLFIENNPDFFQILEDNFTNENPIWKEMLLELGKELVQYKLPFYNEFCDFHISSVFNALIQSKNLQNVFIALFLVLNLTKSHVDYATELVSESTHRHIEKLITNEDPHIPLKVVLLAFSCLKYFALSNKENRQKLFLTLKLESIAHSVFFFFKHDNIINAFFSFLDALLSFPSIQKDDFFHVMELMSKIKSHITRKNIYSFLNTLLLLSEYSYSGKMMEKNTDLLRFLETSFTDMDLNIVKKVSKIIANSLKHGGHLNDPIIASTITHIHSNDFTVIDCANEVMFEILQKSQLNESLNLDIGILIRNSADGTKESRHSSYDLLIFYLMKRNDQIEEALDRELMDIILMFLDSDDEEEQIKTIEFVKILLDYDQKNGSQRNLVSFFDEIEGLQRAHEIYDETENEELITSIQELVSRFYPEELE